MEKTGLNDLLYTPTEGQDLTKSIFPLAGDASRPPSEWLNYLLFYLLGLYSGGVIVGAVLK